MVTTVELSMYPFRESYRELIKDFIRKLQDYPGLAVTPGPTSTYLVGDYAQVMQCLTDMIGWSYAEHGRAVFVAKIMPARVSQSFVQLVTYDADRKNSQISFAAWMSRLELPSNRRPYAAG